MINQSILRHLPLQLPNLLHLGIPPNLTNLLLQEPNLLLADLPHMRHHILTTGVYVLDDLLLPLLLFLGLVLQALGELSDGLVLGGELLRELGVLGLEGLGFELEEG